MKKYLITTVRFSSQELAINRFNKYEIVINNDGSIYEFDALDVSIFPLSNRINIDTKELLTLEDYVKYYGIVK